MNFLAHAYLSFDDKELLVGNFMGDFVKGNKYLTLPHNIQKGILLHRHIDTFTDSSVLIHETKKIVRPFYGHYSGVIIDVFFDHFLANHNIYFSNQGLLTYTQSVYQTLNQYTHLYTANMIAMFSYMEKYNWLYQYKYLEGLEKSLAGMAKRYPNMKSAAPAMQMLNNNYAELQQQFNLFFPILQQSVEQKLNEII